MILFFFTWFFYTIYMSNHSLSEKKIGLLIWHASNYWQAKLRQILKKFNISLNEYLILESLHQLKKNSELITQNIHLNKSLHLYYKK